MIIAENEHRIVSITHDNGSPSDQNQLWFELTVIKTDRGNSRAEMKLVRLDFATANALAGYIKRHTK